MNDEGRVEESPPVSGPLVLYQLVHEWVFQQLCSLTLHLQDPERVRHNA